jgi:hydroxymethylpyrimidine pyrophosphatase-like HAD family hydrolase
MRDVDMSVDGNAMSIRKIIAVDFDGCLVKDEFPDIGDPIPETIGALLAEQERGARIILWTCRRDEQLEEAAEWCKARGINLTAINENLPEMVEFFGEDTRKIFANEYWDDRARQMPPVAR